MLLGLLSDTHDRVDAMYVALQLLRDRGAEFFIHCGDVGSELILDQLAGLPCAFVWGNCDWDRRGLERYAQTIGAQCCGQFGDLTLDGKRIALLHGDDHRLKQRILSEQQHDYLFQGHTHIALDERIGRTRLINPGALHRATVKTIALVNTRTDRVEFIPIPK